MEAGQVEVVYSQSEKIGLPDWSSLKIMGSAKTTVPIAEFDVAYSYLFLVIDTFIKERVEAACRHLNAWANLPTQTLDAGSKQGIVPQGTSIQTVELTCSRIETVGRPNKSAVDLFCSAKTVALAGLEIESIDALYEQLQNQARQKRDVVLANPRPWTNQR